MAGHALLAPSAAARWLSCTAAPRLEESCGQGDTSSVYAVEGSLAHRAAEIRLRRSEGNLTAREAKKQENACMVEAGDLADGAFLEAVSEYVSAVEEIIADYRTKCAIVHADFEEPLDLSTYAPESFGTADVAIIADETLHIIDLKFGKGIPVSAEHNNPQLMLYALGALEKYSVIFDVSTVAMSIFQPRLNNYSTFTIEAQDLEKWGEEVVKPAAQAAFNGKGVFNPSEKACRFCKARAVCKARAKKNLELAELDFKSPDLLSNEEVAEILPKLGELTAWAKDISEYALVQVRDKGATLPGYKLVAGRSNRAFSCEAQDIIKRLDAAGVEDYMTQPSLITLSALERHVGKKKFNELLGDLVTKPEGKPVLVPESDKRPALNSAAAAAKDFATADELPKDLGYRGVGDFDDTETVD